MQFSCLIYVLQINSVSTVNTVERIQVCPNWTCSFCVSSVNDTVFLSCCSLFPIMYLLFKHSPGRPTLQEFAHSQDFKNSTRNQRKGFFSYLHF